MENVGLKIEKNQKIPSNIEAEQALIGSILVNNDVLDEVANIITATKFYDPGHKKIFEISSLVFMITLFFAQYVLDCVNAFRSNYTKAIAVTESVRIF